MQRYGAENIIILHYVVYCEVFIFYLFYGKISFSLQIRLTAYFDMYF